MLNILVYFVQGSSGRLGIVGGVEISGGVAENIQKFKTLPGGRLPGMFYTMLHDLHQYPGTLVWYAPLFPTLFLFTAVVP